MRFLGFLNSTSDGSPSGAAVPHTSHFLHLARRFFASLSPTPLDQNETGWVRATLTPPEIALFDAMPLHDRRHALDVARRVDQSLLGTAQRGDRRWMVAALLHDVGKAESGLGVPGRVMATLLAWVWGRQTVAAWTGRPGVRGRIGLYIDHPDRGAELILVAGGPPEAAAWARLHQQTGTATVPGIPDVVRAALAAADDD